MTAYWVDGGRGHEPKPAKAVVKAQARPPVAKDAEPVQVEPIESKAAPRAAR
jgi:hypothetical protein